MKKYIIKVISFIIVISMLIPVSVFGLDTGTDNMYTFLYPNRTIEIDAINNLSYEQAQLIADRIANNENEVSTYGILCIFGHKIETTYAIETTHKEYAVAPRCVRRTYRVDYCSRSSCSYSEATMTSDIRISCCD